MWFNRLNQQPEANAQHIAQQAQNLLIPDPDIPEDQGGEVGEPAPAAIMPANQNFDAMHADDEAANAMEKAVNMLKNFQWNQEDIKFYFSQVEVKMKSAGVKSNFTKLQVLSTILPPKAINDIKAILLANRH